jgi:hypothetical protein
MDLSSSIGCSIGIGYEYIGRCAIFACCCSELDPGMGSAPLDVAMKMRVAHRRHAYNDIEDSAWRTCANNTSEQYFAVPFWLPCAYLFHAQKVMWVCV